MDMKVYQVVAERQERLPSGQWGNATMVTGYAPLRIVAPKEEIDLIKKDNTYAREAGDEEIINWLADTLGRAAAQACSQPQD